MTSVERIGSYLRINDSTRWFDAKKCAVNTKYGLGVGYREYETVYLNKACLLYEEQFMHCIGSINSAMKYGGIIYIDIAKVENYKLFPDLERLSNLIKGKGFKNIEVVEEYNLILATK